MAGGSSSAILLLLLLLLPENIPLEDRTGEMEEQQQEDDDYPHHRHSFFCVIDRKRIEVPVFSVSEGGGPGWGFIVSAHCAYPMGRGREGIFPGDSNECDGDKEDLAQSSQSRDVPDSGACGTGGRNPWKTGAFTQS
ncbi:uncharacterized protein BDCG_09035 [Blastomyces dermatitidis ER-3]|uniref:Uncharacterized protein n=1 Tax=Ajellomyces dermatitidis (strain ER-3 / ATCC MYA-2586) TaxID=559297 RepID=A0ABP2ESX2_AJEDR|nr:uncharacterized protein BDCG_09035 [Blastomyces dermatitidis ER-3]EEQ85766.1 hypothetical protein BDCG_09035 [Blastomyces dermatitidis ER-3]